MTLTMILAIQLDLATQQAHHQVFQVPRVCFYTVDYGDYDRSIILVDYDW
jgi:hypothetical protein